MNARSLSRGLLAGVMIGAGLMHFLYPQPFDRAVPGYLPVHRALVLISGAFEIAGGAGILIKATRKYAAYGLIALYIAIFPANIDMALHSTLWVASEYRWILIARLPLQLLLIFWSWILRG